MVQQMAKSGRTIENKWNQMRGDFRFQNKTIMQYI